MTRPRLLDLYCGAGGAARGYHDAGFNVVGVDIADQPRYPYRFLRGDALLVLKRLVAFAESGREDPQFGRIDAIHASPPCQDYSRAMRHLAAPGYPRLIAETRALLVATGLPWVIENVPGSPLATGDTLDGAHGVELCGSMFGLRINRHRLFETNFPVSPPRGCDHSRPAMNPHFAPSRDSIRVEFGLTDAERPWRDEMGVSWMTREEGREAIPPAFTEYVGRALINQLRVAA